VKLKQRKETLPVSDTYAHRFRQVIATTAAPSSLARAEPGTLTN